MIEGYKDSKLGKIPIDWEVNKFKEVTKTLTDYVASGSFASLKENVTVFDEPNYAVYVRQVDLNSNFKKKLKYIDKSSYDFLKNSNLFPNDIIFTNIGDLGRVSIMPNIEKKASIAPNILLIRADEKKLNQKFYYYILNSYETQKEIHKIKSGTGLPKINKGDLKEIWLKIPPLPEQQKIADILSTVDAKIDIIDQQITETQELKKGLMQRLLTKGIGHTEFKESPLGEIPKSWRIVKLGDIANIVDPQPDHRTPAEVEDGIPYIGMGDIKNGKIDFEGARKVSQEALKKQIKGFNIYKDAFVFGKIGTIGNPTPIPTERFFALSANLILMTAEQESIAKYLYVIIQSNIIDKQLRLMTNTTSQPALGIKKARNLKVPLPEENERNKISSIIKLIDDKLRTLLDKKENYQELKKGLMQQLLTGKVRVRV